jgi:hypothetical protein
MIMTAIQLLSASGGTVRIMVSKSYQKTAIFKILGNVIISFTVLNRVELVPVNIFTIQGTLNRHLATNKLSLDFGQCNFGAGFDDYINVYAIKKLLDLIPEETSGKESHRFIEFRVLEDGTIENVPIYNAFKQKRKLIAENIEKIVKANVFIEEAEGEQVDINALIIGINEKEVAVD